MKPVICALVLSTLALGACSGGGSGSSVPTTTRQSTNGTAAESTNTATASAVWQSLNSQTVQPGTNIASFAFAVQDNSRLLVTENDRTKNLYLGNHAGETIMATVNVTGVTGAFTYYGEGTSSNPCGTPATVRLFFESTGGPFAYTDYWWADASTAAYQLANGTATLTATLDTNSAWSDWNGKSNTVDSATTAAFVQATKNITMVGLSFGGGCFFENGVGTSDRSGIFNLQSFSD